CRNAGKRLATNQEWQVAAFGTRDVGAVDNGTTDCNVSTGTVVPTGSPTSCRADVGGVGLSGNTNDGVGGGGPLSSHRPGWGGVAALTGCASPGRAPGARVGVV